ncbi:MAG: molybdopterin biosynthesis protein, partial [Gracilibacteraceae bacterium]|nr:molybdopterin biosynthesis protein [Gracilibacteraceae bacterium]
MAERNLYLKNTPVEEARAIYLERLKKLIRPRPVVLPVSQALGRTTYRAVFARLSSPFYNAAAMDGVAVIAAHTAGASEVRPRRLRLHEDFQPIDTGDPVLHPYDAVIMAEDINEVGAEEIEIMAAVSPWKYVRPVGEDFAHGEMILPGGHTVRAIDIGVLLAGGVTTIEVLASPRTAIIPTGSELLDPEAPAAQQPPPGAIIDSNSQMLAALIREAGGAPERLPIAPDDYATLKRMISDALTRCDVLIINAGSSAGSEDYTVHILRELGEVLVHGVATKPGKPVILAVCAGKAVIGLPGYPLAAYYNFENFVLPVLACFTGRSPAAREQVRAVLTQRLVSSLKYREYVRVKVGAVGGRLICSPLSRGAAAMTSLVRADGFLVLEQQSEGAEAGAEVEVSLYRPLSEVGQTLVVVGSHDLILD